MVASVHKPNFGFVKKFFFLFVRLIYLNYHFFLHFSFLCLFIFYFFNCTLLFRRDQSHRHPLSNWTITSHRHPLLCQIRVLDRSGFHLLQLVMWVFHRRRCNASNHSSSYQHCRPLPLLLWNYGRKWVRPGRALPKFCLTCFIFL